MKVKFPQYFSSFLCDYPTQEAKNRVLNMASCKNNNLKIEKEYCDDSQQIILSSNTNSYLYRNAFLPVVSINIRESNGKTNFELLFALRKSVKVFMILYFFLALLFELILLVQCVTEHLSMSAIVFLPLGILICSYALCTLGLFFSSKRVFEILFSSLNDEASNHIPKIHKYKGN